ncbi:hypothetical protein [Megasphaera sueciensis]|uniref:hypothetical protein n=1 Tax=Megasphaera sueciensis TaxID=349094 RepID=UPI003D058B81
MDYTCMPMITIKQGDTFGYPFSMADSAGNPITGIAGKLKSQIRDSFDNIISETTITETSTPGLYLLLAVNSSAGWPLSGCFTDIRYTDSQGMSDSIVTIGIRIIKEVSR